MAVAVARKNKGPGRRWGRQRLPADQLRQVVKVYLDQTELLVAAELADGAGLSLSAFGRRAMTGQRVHAIPSVENLQAWRNLARLAANLNQVAAAINVGRVEVIGDGVSRLLVQIGVEVACLRAQLIGADDPDSQADDDPTSTTWGG